MGAEPRVALVVLDPRANTMWCGTSLDVVWTPHEPGGHQDGGAGAGGAGRLKAAQVCCPPPWPSPGRPCATSLVPLDALAMGPEWWSGMFASARPFRPRYGLAPPSPRAVLCALTRASTGRPLPMC
jgi:hypothetical protein